MREIITTIGNILILTGIIIIVWSIIDLIAGEKELQPEYRIELLNQKQIYIQSETQSDTIQFDSIGVWIETDTAEH